jgi:hypothetical protein
LAYKYFLLGQTSNKNKKILEEKAESNMKVQLTITVGAFLLLGTLSMLEGKATLPPRYPTLPSGTFNGTAYMYGKTLPYVLYQDIVNERHMDFAGPFMLGAYLNGTGYLQYGDGCKAYPNEPFPFPADLLKTNHATYIGREILLDIDPNIVMQHWAVKINTMGADW